MSHLVELAADPETWLALATLVVMEVVLGIDNLVFVAIVANRLAPQHRATARRLGLGMALVLRLALLATIASLVGLTRPVITLFAHAFSIRDLILAAGGLFLIWKATTEIRANVDPRSASADKAPGARSGLAAAIAQIIVLDLVFSIDSILTAVGMTDELPIMTVAVIIAVALMLWASGPLSVFIHQNPSVVMLALSFLLMIGVTLVAEALGSHVPKGYIYAAMVFSGFVEALNFMARARRDAGRG